MDSENLHVVIIGGSLAGLFTGITLKSLPNVAKITILERYEIQDLQDLGAGIRCNQEANDAILEYAGIAPENYAALLTTVRSLSKAGAVVAEQKAATYATTWAQLYRAFRECFDADSKGSYHHGCTLVGLSQAADDKVQVQYRNQDAETEMILANLVVGADGASSKVRSLMTQDAIKRTVAGYVCYRGVVDEEYLSEAALQIFQLSGTFVWTPASQFVCYAVPSDEAPADKAKMCVNWVWYRNKSDEELRQLMTDKMGKLHSFTLPHGGMREEEIEKINVQAKEELPPVCIEIVEKTTEPFIQVVTDSMATKASYFDGKLILVGDAVGGQRPHTASALLQGSYHAILVRQYLAGQIDSSVLEENTLKMSRILVDGGQKLGKILMVGEARTPESIPAYMKVYLGIQAELNALWKETIGLGDAPIKM